MKILLVITSGDLGGAQNFLINLAIGLKTQGHQVLVGMGAGEYLEKKLITNKINYQKFSYLRRTNNPLNNLLFVWQFKKFLDHQQFNIVHFNSSNTLLGVISNYWSKNKARSVFTVHGLSILDPLAQINCFKKFIYFIYFKYLLKLVDQIIFVSQSNLREAYVQKITNRGQVIYNGIELSTSFFLEKNIARQALSELCQTDLNNSFLIGSIGRLASPKNYSFLINVFSEIKKIKPLAKIVIIGSGPEEKDIQRLIQKLNFKTDIYLVGTQDKAARYSLAFDVFVLPSIYEGLSITLLEAQQANIPILASDVGGNREVLQDSKFLFTVNDTSDFLKKFTELPSATYNYPKNVNFSLDKMIKEYLKVYQN